MRELVFYCDESVKNGSFFSNFYGGALVESKNLEVVKETLEQRKKELQFHGEVKFQKITENYLSKYCALIDTIFDLMDDNKIKMRIMFTQNYFVATELTQDDVENAYFKLYYQFIKHAFGLRFVQNGPVRLRLLFDEFPDKKDKVNAFRSYLHGMENLADLRQIPVYIPTDHITEVRSHDHVILQCLDIVLGAMQFRLNDLHKVTDPHTGKRGKRTKAKEQVYKHILSRIRRTHPYFNPGITTSTYPLGPKGSWEKHYLHWLFKPKEHKTNKDFAKK